MSYTSTESDHNDNGTRWEGNGLKKGPWSSSEDDILIDYIHKHGEGNWNAVQKHTGLLRCGKSCRLRWANHLRPNLKKGAFSLEEERLIVELHAKMGNRWARMAAHLPGRTDNEIKNYWNTRVKKRERAGLPLYPHEMRVEELEWSHSRILGEDRRLQFESCDSNVFFDGLNFVTDASDLTCNLLGDGASSPSYGNFLTPIVPSSKRLRGSEALYPEQFCQNTDQQEIPKTCSFSVPYMIPDSHTFSDGIVPTSSPTFGAVKLELPSFQYSEATFDQWKRSASPPHSELLDPYLQSPPPMGRDELDFVSSYDTGLLDMLLLEAKCRNSSTKNSLYKSCDSTATSGVVGEVCVSQIKAEEFEDSFKSLVYSGISISSQYNADGVPLRQREKEQKPVLDVTRPDVWLASSWLDHGLGIVKETGTVSDALAVLLGDDVGNDYTQMSIGSSSGVVGSCPWSNMPPVCQND